MEHVINPFWIYCIGIVGELKDLFLVVGIFSTIFWGVAIITKITAMCDTPEYNPDKHKRTIEVVSGFLKPLGIVFVTALLLHVLIPSPKTIIGMAVANVVTVDRANAAVEFTKEEVFGRIDSAAKAIFKSLNEGETEVAPDSE